MTDWIDSPNKQAIMDTTIQPKNSQESAIVGDYYPEIIPRSCEA